MPNLWYTVLSLKQHSGEEGTMKLYAISGVRRPFQLSRKLLRHRYIVSVSKGVVYAWGEERPWGVLAGYASQVRVVSLDDAPARLRELIERERKNGVEQAGGCEQNVTPESSGSYGLNMQGLDKL
jgi:hypothetical protein